MVITKITSGIAKIIGQKALDILTPILFIIVIFFIAKMLVVKATGWSKEDILQNQLENRATVIEAIKEVNKESATAVNEAKAGIDVQQQQAVETIERLDATQLAQVKRQVGIVTAEVKAQVTADHHAEAARKADPTKPVPSTAEFTSPLSPEDLAFIRTSNAALLEAYQAAVASSK